MQRRERFLLVFFILLFISAIILLASFLGGLKVFSVFERALTPIGVKVSSVFKEQKEKEGKLDAALLQSEIEKLKKENAALKDQFQTTNPKSFDLLPARIVGSPGFIPGVTTPADLIVDKGETDRIKKGDTVAVKDNLVGRISRVSSYLAKAELVFNARSSFTAETLKKGTSGIVKGNGKEIIFDNVLLSEDLEEDEIVVTKGDMDLEGIGYPPDLIVGKIVAIDKDPSKLFQKAKLESFVDFEKLEMVFILNRGE